MQQQDIFTINNTNIKTLNDNTCVICLDNLIEEQVAIKTICNHVFHKKCFCNYAKTLYLDTDDY